MFLMFVLIATALAVSAVAAFAAYPTDGMRRLGERVRGFTGRPRRLPVQLSKGPLAGWTIHTGARPVFRACR